MIHIVLPNIAKGAILYIAALPLFLACKGAGSQQTAETLPVTHGTSPEIVQVTPEQLASPQMEIGKLTLHTFHHAVSANGMFDVPPESRASVSAYYAGYVSDVSILPGQKVVRGQVLFTLENPDYVMQQKNFLETKEQLSYLKANYERQKSLIQDRVTSQKSYAKAETDYKVMLARYGALKKQLELMKIDPEQLSPASIQSKISVRAPIGGYLGEVNINKGMYLSPANVAVTIVNPKHLHLELSIFEKDLQSVKPGQAIVFKLLSNPAKEYGARVHLVGKTINPEKRTIQIHGHLTDESLSGIFTPGMYVEARILTTSEDHMALPNAAIVEVDGRNYVLQQKENKDNDAVFEKREVEIGSRDEEYTQLVNALEFPDTSSFLVKGAFNLITE